MGLADSRPFRNTVRSISLRRRLRHRLERWPIHIKSVAIKEFHLFQSNLDHRCFATTVVSQIPNRFLKKKIVPGCQSGTNNKFPKKCWKSNNSRTQLSNHFLNCAQILFPFSLPLIEICICLYPEHQLMLYFFNVFFFGPLS